MKNGSKQGGQRFADGEPSFRPNKLRAAFSRISAWRRNSEGAELLEFALALPIILVMMVGLLDFAHAYNIKQKLANAARAGARLGGTEPMLDLTNTSPGSVQAVKDDVTAYLQQANIDTSFISATMTPAGTDTWTYYSSGNYGLEIDRGYVVKDASGNSIPSTRVILRYPYDWSFGFNHIIKLLVPSATFAGPIDIETDATMANPN